jgi:hypothetical protein
MRTLSSYDQRELCKAVNARIDVMLSQSQKQQFSGNDRQGA